VFLELGSFCQLPRALARRLARRAIELAKGDLRGIEFEHVEGVMRLAESLHGHGRFQIPGLDVLRSFDRIRLAPRRPDGLEGRNWRLAVEAPGEIQVPGTSLTLVLELSLVPDETCAVPARYNEGVSELDWDLVPGPLELRNWRPGDQYHRPEQAHPEKLKILFQEARVPLWERRNWPILTSGDQVIWTRRFGVAAKYAAGPGTRRVLRIREKGV
jgi:tRNA(Ile)-lysidine synthase